MKTEDYSRRFIHQPSGTCAISNRAFDGIRQDCYDCEFLAKIDIQLQSKHENSAEGGIFAQFYR